MKSNQNWNFIVLIKSVVTKSRRKIILFSINLAEKSHFNHLIEHNFINEERFAQSFVRGKHNYKFWGKNRIVNELKFRNISSRIITIALKEIQRKPI